MALFKSGNPALSEKRFRDTVLDEVVTHENAMTVKGTLQKFGFLSLMTMATAFYSWKFAVEGGNAMPLVLAGAIGGFIVAITIAFLVFVFMSIIILFIFTSARKVIVSNPINIKRINEVIEVF